MPYTDSSADCGSGTLTTAWPEISGPSRTVIPGAQSLFTAGENLLALYAIHSGCIKTCTVDSDGHERIRGFFLPGDLLGLDSLGGGRMRSTAMAVLPSRVRALPMTGFQRLLAKHSDIPRRLIEQISHELALSLALSGDFSADQRLAAFLLHMQERLDSIEGLIVFPMTQREIGNYLRLASETVCRTLKGFERKGWLQCEGSSIRMLLPKALHLLAEPVGICQPFIATALAS
jgi:CRP/FNR family transcriptional regulator